jgi:DNA-binding GntR family transcriptional regulator
MLEKEGFVTIIPRKGARVSSISKEEVENIWEIRSVLEGYAARTAARKCTESELQKMEAILEKISQEEYNFPSYTRADMKMHELLYKHLENKMLKETIERVRQNALRILNLALKKLVFDKKSAIQDTHDHIKIVDALKTHDPERTETAFKLHLKNSKQRIIQALENRE